MFLNSILVYKYIFINVLTGLFNDCNKPFFCRLKHTGEILQTNALIKELYTAKMYYWYQLISNVFL